MSHFSAIHTYDSSISADGSFEREKEETMEKIINNAPFALVLVFLVIGFVLLIKGADFFVEGSSSVAKRLHVPSIIIGFIETVQGMPVGLTAATTNFIIINGPMVITSSNFSPFANISLRGTQTLPCLP